MKSTNKKINSEQKCIRRITNDDLVCKDCIFKNDDSKRIGNTSSCKLFNEKSNEVLLGGKCLKYKNKIKNIISRSEASR